MWPQPKNERILIKQEYQFNVSLVHEVKQGLHMGLYDQRNTKEKKHLASDLKEIF